jgi:low affinity Fe/Cu permease
MTWIRQTRVVFDRFSGWMTRFSGTSWAFVTAVGLIVTWALTGPLFDYSNTWQLFINTTTTIVTFLMVFLIQHTQNKDSLAIHLKLNELLAATVGASNRLMSIEDLTDEELAVLHSYYQELAETTKATVHLLESHSIEEARALHEGKPTRTGKEKPIQH